MATPKLSVKVAQMTTSQPWARSQPRFVGRKRAGRESKKVTKTKMALTTPAVSGHWPSSKFWVTFATVCVSRIAASDINEKPSSSPPHPAKRKSNPRKASINLFGMMAIYE